MDGEGCGERALYRADRKKQRDPRGDWVQVQEQSGPRMGDAHTSGKFPS